MEIMKKSSEINIERLFDAVANWEDWYAIEKEIFTFHEWPQYDNNKIDEMLSRESFKSKGILWEATCTHYDVERELEFKYEKLRNLVFDKLEPEAAKENDLHPEWYGKMCVICSIWTRDFSTESCAICGHELILFPLNES